MKKSSNGSDLFLASAVKRRKLDIVWQTGGFRLELRGGRLCLRLRQDKGFIRASDRIWSLVRIVNLSLYSTCSSRAMPVIDSIWTFRLFTVAAVLIFTSIVLWDSHFIYIFIY